jgi:hypothetical protein
MSGPSRGAHYISAYSLRGRNICLVMQLQKRSTLGGLAPRSGVVVLSLFAPRVV